MKYNLNSVNLQIRQLFLAALFTIAGIVLVSQLSDTSSYTDDTARIRVLEVQEFNGDSEPPLDNQASSVALLFSLLPVFASVLIILLVHSVNVTSSLSFLFHIRPRSPPLA